MQVSIIVVILLVALAIWTNVWLDCKWFKYSPVKDVPVRCLMK